MKFGQGRYFLMLLASLIAACGKGPSLSGEGSPVESAFFEGEPVQIDSALSLYAHPKVQPEQLQTLRGDFNALKNLSLSGVPPDATLRQIFGGITPDRFSDYIDTRLSYLVTPDVVADEENFPMYILSSQVTPEETLARNQGIGSWLVSKATGRETFFNFGSRVYVNSSRIGLVRLYSSHFATDKKYSSNWGRLSILVHEARHSDCTGGVNSTQLADIRARYESGSSEIFNSIVGQSTCGHLHVNCPPGHELAGKPACDGLAWGAYAIEMYFNKAIADYCTSCSTRERAMSRTLAADAANRILVLQSMQNGSAGVPDMTSTN